MDLITIGDLLKQMDRPTVLAIDPAHGLRRAAQILNSTELGALAVTDGKTQKNDWNYYIKKYSCGSGK